jgi:hypothetical protein
VAETPEREPQAETLNEEARLENLPVVLDRRPSRMSAIVFTSVALAVTGAAAIYALPQFNIELPNFRSLAKLFPRETTVSVPIPDPVITAMLRDVQSTQQQNLAALQENGTVLEQNTAVLQRGAATLESFRQGLAAQQTSLKTISNQLSSLAGRVDSLQNAVAPLTTSSIPQPNAHARLVGTSRRKSSQLPRPVGPVSVGGAPLYPAPGAG